MDCKSTLSRSYSVLPTTIALLHLCVSISTLKAGEPVLLATMSADHQCGRNILYDAVWPVIFYSPQPFMPETVLFEDIELRGPFPVTTFDTLSIDDDPDFLIFSEYITNGINDHLYDGHWSATGLLNLILVGPFESIALDTVVPTFGPDLIGYEIESVVRDVTIDIQSPGHDPNGDGIWTDIIVTGQYEFYGELIPEPSSMFLLVATFSWLLLSNGRQQEGR